MWSSDRNALRQFFFQAWQKHRLHQSPESLELRIIDIVKRHPEYHTFLENEHDNLERDFTDPDAQNPFLHLSLHLAIDEQIMTNRPLGITQLYQQLCQKSGDSHQAEHAMIDVLLLQLQQAQQQSKMPDETLYLSELRKIIQK